MAQTYRQVINDVLRVLGEEEVATSALGLTSNYQKLIGYFVNLAKEEVEDAAQWRALRHTETVTVPAGNTSAVLPNTNDKSRLYREQSSNRGELRPLVFDVTNTSNSIRLTEIDLPTLLIERELNTSSSTNTYFQYFSMEDTPGDPNGELNAQLYPECTTDRDIKFTIISPQTRLGNDDLDTVILVPTEAVELGALYYALEERGEELGLRGVFTEQKYRTKLDAAVARDMAAQGSVELVPV